jgi:hypothetical protein
MVDVYFQFTVFKRSFELEATSVNFHVEQITDRPTDDSHHSSLPRSIDDWSDALPNKKSATASD